MELFRGIRHRLSMKPWQVVVSRLKLVFVVGCDMFVYLNCATRLLVELADRDKS